MDEKLREFEENFSVLDRYGTDVTKDEYVTNPAIGRDKQIKELILILLTPEKSAILIGKPGIGKTAIVEGLAYRIQIGDVPDALKGYTIINIKTASLLGTMPSGESKVQKMIDELKTKEKVILFIDEIHMLIGATDSSSLDFANIFKEGLGRGSIKVIGATTTEEYERYILRDKAFTRRFQKVEVPEPTRDEVIEIMMGTLPKFEHQTGKKMKYSPFIQRRIMTFLVDITSEYKRVYALGSRYPDVSLTLLKQAFSYTVYDGREFMDIFDVRKAIEDTKNIYQDVKKKELPRFDKEFEDIILEEKGEKPIEEWRKDEPGVNQDNVENSDNKEVLVETYDKLVEDKKKQQEVIGKTKPKRDRSAFNNKKDSKELDDLLITGGIGLIEKDKSGVSVPITDYKVTKELMDDGLNDLLLNSSIGSILDTNDDVGEVRTYKRDNTVNNKLLSKESKNIIIEDVPRKKREINLYELYDPNKDIEKPKEIKPKKDISKKGDMSLIDISKYVNRLTNEEKAKIKLKEELDKKKEDDVKKESIEGPIEEIKETKEEKDNKDKSEKGDESMYGQNYGNGMDYYGMGGGQGYMPNGNPGYGMPPQNDPYGNQGGYGGGFAQPPQQPMGMPDQSFGMGQMVSPGMSPMGMPDPGMGAMPQSQPPMGNELQSQSPFGNQSGVGGFLPSEDKSTNTVDPNRETLFGVPMYDETKEKEIQQTTGQPMAPQGGFGMPDPMGMPGAVASDPFNNRNESFFGAPMYSNNMNNNGIGPAAPGNDDIFGQLLLPENNMRIKGGKIVDDFSSLTLPPESGRMIIGDVTNSQGFAPPPQGPMAPQSGFGMPDQGFGMMGPQQPMGMNQPSQFGMPDQSFGMMPPQNQFGLPQQGGFGMQDPGYGMGQPSPFGMPDQGFGMPPQSQFGMNQNMYGGNTLQPPPGNNGMYMGGGFTNANPFQMRQGPVFNELKVENNLLKKTPDDGGDFVNYSDLNKGKVDKNDMNKYVSQPKEEKPVPRVDLNLEAGAKDEEDDYLD